MIFMKNRLIISIGLTGMNTRSTSIIDKQNRDPGEETVSEAMTGRDIRLPEILY